jgi:hypothetical protein
MEFHESAVVTVKSVRKALKKFSKLIYVFMIPFLIVIPSRIIPSTEYM